MNEVKNETTASIDAASTESEPLEQQASETHESGQSDSIPEKFVGKSALEIAKSYGELEKSFHKISSERAEEKKHRDELEKKFQAIEERLNQRNVEAPRSEPQIEEEDPLAEFDEEFENNPKEVIKKSLKKINDKAATAAKRALMQTEAQRAAEYYQQQKKDNPDFAKLEPRMTSLAQEFGDLVSPEKANSAKAIKLLHLAARGAEVDSYVSEAVNRAKKEATTTRQEKKAAFSEGTSTETGTSKRFTDMSLEEMEKALGRADD